ncbi:MAG: BTAD domain-containing putative transcriptional regulator [Gammaproteobacteria bacterium]
MLLLEQEDGGHEPAGTEEYSPQWLFDYFAREVLMRMEPQAREWLFKSAQLPRMTTAMATQVCASENAGELIEQLYRGNYFIYRHSEHTPVYEFHPLFREFLLRQAEDALDAGSLQQTRSRAASSLEEEGALEDAVELYIKVGAWSQVSRLVHQNARIYLSQGRGRLLAEWIASLPEAVLDGEPWLRCWQGYCHLPFDIGVSRPLFERAYGDLRTSNDAAGAVLAWSGLIDTFQLGQGRDPHLLDRWIAEARSSLLASAQGLPDAVQAYLTHAMLLALVFREPGKPDCREWATRAETSLRCCADIDIRVRTAMVLMVYRLWMGDYAAARLLSTEIESWLQGTTVSPLTQLTASWANIMCEWMTGSPAEAVRRVESGIRLGRRAGVLLWERILLGHGVEAALTDGDTTTARRWLKELEAGLNPDLMWDYSQYHHLACLEALERGTAATALEHAQINFSAIKGNALIYLEALARLDLMASLQATGEPVAAAQELEAAWKVIDDIDSRLFRFMAYMGEASLALDAGQEPEAISALRIGLAIGRRCEFRNCWSWRKRVMQHLCIKALEHGIEVPYVKSLIRERCLIPDQPPLGVIDYPWPVRIWTLGGFYVQVAGEPLRFTGKTQKKPLEMLMVLLAFGARGAPLSRIEETVWPDAEGDAAHRSLSTALHRLRKLLGHHDALILEASSLSLNPRYCWLDRWLLEAKLDGLDNALHAATNSELQKLKRALLDLYGGPFLASEIDAAWVLPPREHLQRRILRAILKLGRHWEAQSNWEEAADCYRRGLNLEPYNGALCHRLMLAYREMNLHAEAVLAYRQYRENLSRRDGSRPAPEIEIVYQGIAHGREILH